MSARSDPVREHAYAKLNLVLHVGAPEPGGLHPICSIFASLDLADDLLVRPSDARADTVECDGVEGPNLAAAALAAFRAEVPGLPPLQMRIEKRIPVAAGLGGGSADAAAALRAANRIAGEPLGAARLREVAATLGSDVPSQVEPRHARVSGIGDVVEPIDLPLRFALLVPQREGLSAAAVYAEFDRMGLGRDSLDCHELGAGSALENDLQPAAIALRPELTDVLDALRAAGAREALVSGSGPTCFALFDSPAAAVAAATGTKGALVTSLRSP
jgi:4-diphosphocytidyl-2-C-methyl-D-erythritol kinase